MLCACLCPALRYGVAKTPGEYSNFCNTHPSKACNFDPTAAPGEPGACDYGACITGTFGDANVNYTAQCAQPPPSPNRLATDDDAGDGSSDPSPLRRPEQGPQRVVSYDLSYTNKLPATSRFEHVHTVAALGGLVNRDGPKLFTPLLVPGGAVDNGAAADAVWRQHLTQPGRWLSTTSWTNMSSLEAVVSEFKDLLDGVVLYDPAVPATSSLASTAAGVEGLLPVCFRPGVAGSVYERLVAGGPRLSVSLNLTGMFVPQSSGVTPKLQAYRWARERWLSPDAPAGRRANPSKLGYYADYWAALQGDRLKAAPGLTEVSNHDYFISHKAFFFDLSVWADEAPVDDPDQALGGDKAELVAIFESCYRLSQAAAYTGPKMLHVGGFTPWWFKYTSDGPGCPKCKHKGVETEWETMDVIGAYQAFDDGDACCVGAMANAAFYQHYPLPDKLVQNAPPTVASLKQRGLIHADGTVAPKPFAAYCKCKDITESRI